MANIYFIGGATDDHFKLELFDDSPEVVDKVLDQLNLGKVRFISPDEYKVPDDRMRIELTDERAVKVAELECQDPGD